MELLKTIALLCQLSGDYTFVVKDEQLKCQKYYIDCVRKKSKSFHGNIFNLANEFYMEQCIKERK